jgi:hypothetical protein
VTIDEELTLLDSQLRRLKIDYEIYFSNPTKRPPTDVEWKVLSLLRKFSDGGGRMSFSQRFRYNEIAQRYAIYSDLWRKKNRIREEGYRRPQDAILSVQGVRPEEREPEHKVYGVGNVAAATATAAANSGTATAATPASASVAAPEPKPFSVQCGDARAERDQVRKLYQALTEAKKKSGETVSGNLDSFSSFVQKKTDQIRKQYGCEAVEYTVEVQNGQVKLKAKAKT